MLLHDGGDPPHLRQRFGTLPAGEKRLRFEPAYGLHEPADGLQERLQFAGRARRRAARPSCRARTSTSYGAVRDIEKWPARDRRERKRDVINFEEYNPYITEAMLRAVDTLHTLAEEDPDAPSYVYRKAVIRAAALKRGIGLYNKFVVAALGAMLDRGESAARYDGSGRWLDVAGQYVTKREVEAILDAVDRGELTTPEEVDNRFRVFFVHYDDYAHSWAEGIYASLLGRVPTAAEIGDAIEAGRNAREAMRRTTDADRERDCSLDMAVSYGLDSDDEREVRDDYYSVRGLK